MADEPASASVSVFESDGTALLTLNLRDGGNVSQIMIGLTANQTLQLAERLTFFAHVLRRAIADGNGGTRFPDHAPKDHRHGR